MDTKKINNSIKVFQMQTQKQNFYQKRKRETLLYRPELRIKSHKKRENRQVCAGTSD